MGCSAKKLFTMDDEDPVMEMYKAKAIVIEKEVEIKELRRRIEEMDRERQQRNQGEPSSSNGELWEAIRNIQKSMEGAETQKLEETEIIKIIHDRVTALEETNKFDRVERRLEEITARLERNEAENVQKGMEELKEANAQILERMATWEVRIKGGNETVSSERSLRQSSNDQPHARQCPLEDEGRLQLPKDGRIGTDLIEKDSTKRPGQDEETQKPPLKKEDKSVTEATADGGGSAVAKRSTQRSTKLSNGTRGIKLSDMSLSRETKERRRTEEEGKQEDEDNESDSKLRKIVNTLSNHQVMFSKTTVACIKECERIFAQMRDDYGQYTTDAGYPYKNTSVNSDYAKLLYSMKVKQAEQEELKQERWQILDLCAEVRIHIKYKSPTMTADSFRMHLIRLIEDVESKQRQGGSYREIISDLQSVLKYYDQKVMDVGDAVEKKTRNILTEYEIEGKLLNLRRLKHYGKVLIV